MFAPQIVVNRHFPIQALRLEGKDDEWLPTPEYEALVEAEWARLIRDSTGEIWDGTYYRVLNRRDLENETSDIRLLLGIVRYRYIASFPALHEVHACMGLHPLNHLSTIALIETADHFYLFGRRARSGAIEVIGGGVQPDEMAVTSGADIEETLYKEIREEVGICKEDIVETEGLGIVSSSNSNVLIVGRVHSDLAKAQAQSRFSERTEGEMDALTFVPQDQLCSFLSDLADYRRLIPQLLGAALR